MHSADVTPSVRARFSLRSRTGAFGAFGVLSLMGTIAAIAMQRPEALGLAAPFVIVVCLGVTQHRARTVDVVVAVNATRVLEEAEVVVEVQLTSPSDIGRVEVEVQASDRLVPQTALRTVARLVDGSARLRFSFTAKEWGLGTVDAVHVRAVDRFGLFSGSVELTQVETIRISLPDRRARNTLGAERFRTIVGSHPSRDRGSGIELADIRPIQPGDSFRDLNGRITNRRGEPWVNLRHPDRSASLVVVVDAHEKVDASIADLQRQGVNAALGLIDSHLAVHDPVGLLVVGHKAHWFRPALGRAHMLRMTDALISVSNTPNASLRMYQHNGVNNVPADATVLAVSPLLDERMVRCLAGLRRRGNHVSVLVPSTAPRTHPPSLTSRMARAAQPERHRVLVERLASTQRRIGIRQLETHGVVVAEWSSDQPLESVVSSIATQRRAMARQRTR